MNLNIPGAIVSLLAGLLLGAANYGLLRLAAKRAGRASSRAAAVACILGGYAVRYLLILGLTLLLVRYYNVRVALACLMGMLLATLGMAVFGRRQPAAASAAPPASDTPRNPPD